MHNQFMIMSPNESSRSAQAKPDKQALGRL